MDDNPVEVERPGLTAPLEKARGIKRPASKHPTSSVGLRTLAIDVGGTHLKAVLLSAKGKMIADEVVIDTPHPCPPKTFLKLVDKLISALPTYDRVSVGFPGFVRRGTIVTAPHLGTKPWQDFALADVLAERLGKPVRVLNDADVQGFGLIQGAWAGDGPHSGDRCGDCPVPRRGSDAAPRIGSSPDPQQPDLR